MTQHPPHCLPDSSARLPALPTQPFLGFRLARCTVDAFIEFVVRAARQTRHGGAPCTVAYLNAATVNLAFEQPDFARLLAAMDCLYPDGQAVVWASRWLGAPVPERINAGDFTRELIERLATEGLALGLVGGRAGEADAAAEAFRRWAPSLRVVFVHGGYFTPAEAEAVRAQLEAADPDLVWLGMGSPKQERLAIEWARAGRARVWWCVGALFEYYAGVRRRAPRWMRRAGLERTVRLALEPRRLWRRYVIGNPQFVWRVVRGHPPAGLSQRSSATTARPGR